MPCICRFNGLSVYAYREQHHNFPHIHIIKADGTEYSISLDGRWEEGNWNALTGKQRKMIRRLLEQRGEELRQAWEDIQLGKQPRWVEPPDGADVF